MRFREFLKEDITEAIVINDRDVEDGRIIRPISNTCLSFSLNRKLIMGFDEGHCPVKVMTKFSIFGSPQKSLEHGPTWVGGDFVCRNASITSIEHAPLYVGDFCDLMFTDLVDLKGIGKLWLKEIEGTLSLMGCRPTSHVLGIFLIKSLEDVDWFMADENCQDILRNHFNSDKDILECQEDLIQAGYKEYAKL